MNSTLALYPFSFFPRFAQRSTASRLASHYGSSRLYSNSLSGSPSTSRTVSEFISDNVSHLRGKAGVLSLRSATQTHTHTQTHKDSVPPKPPQECIQVGGTKSAKAARHRHARPDGVCVCVRCKSQHLETRDNEPPVKPDTPRPRVRVHNVCTRSHSAT